VNVIQQQGEGSGLGAVAGGVAGALLGNQVGGGSGRKIATVAGAAGGAYAGHQIEKHVKTTKRYDVVVRMDDGSTRTFPYENEPAFRAGSKVKVVDGALVAN
jgi:outer membrane lipoprotein SlyB